MDLLTQPCMCYSKSWLSRTLKSFSIYFKCFPPWIKTVLKIDDREPIQQILLREKARDMLVSFRKANEKKKKYIFGVG